MLVGETEFEVATQENTALKIDAPPLPIVNDSSPVLVSNALEHEMPDGRREISTLKTGEIAWRPGATHVGHNLGKTDLWVIAIEPK